MANVEAKIRKAEEKRDNARALRELAEKEEAEADEELDHLAGRLQKAREDVEHTEGQMAQQEEEEQAEAEERAQKAHVEAEWKDPIHRQVLLEMHRDYKEAFDARVAELRALAQEGGKKRHGKRRWRTQK